MPQVVRVRDLQPTWTTRRAREPGFRRWLVTWVGGPAGHINTNPDVAVRSLQCAVGLMVLPVGQRQAGLHVHGVAEIYVVLEGAVEGRDGTALTHRAGLMDCTVTPAGCPHGVRNCGAEDVVLVWVHDGIERNDAAVYYEDDDRDFAGAPGMQLVRFAELPRAGTTGEATWVHGPADAGGPGACSARVAVGLTVLGPGGRAPAGPLPATRFHLVTAGEAVLEAPGGEAVLGRLDGVNVPAGEVVALRNDGPAPLHLLHVDSPPG